MPAPTPRLLVDALEDRAVPAAIGALDQSFGTAGVFVDTALAGGAFYRAADLTPDGAIIAVGGTNTRFLVTRLLPNGSIDPAFGSKQFETAGAGTQANAVQVLANGQIIVVGTALIGGDTDIVTLRLDAAGNQIDRDVQNIAVGANDTGDGVVVNETTGDVYVVGSTTSNNDFVAYRLNTTLDVQGTIQTPTFGGTDTASGVALDSTGRVYVAGTANTGNIGVVRYNADMTGEISREYDLGGADLGRGIAINQTTGQIFVVGRTDVTGSDDYAVLRVGADLPVATQAQIILPVGVGTVDRATGIVIDPFGRVVVSGRSGAQLAVARLTADLVRDTVFGTNGVSTITLPGAAGTIGTGVAFDAANRIVVVGASGANPAAIRVTNSVGLPSRLAVGGNTNGAVPLFPTSGPAYSTTPVTTLTPIPGTPVNSVLADVNGDGTPDLISGVTAGGDRVVVQDGRDPSGATVFASFAAFGGFAGGVFVAAGDLNGDGKAEVLVSPVRGGFGPRVAVFSGVSLTGATTNPTRLADFNGIADALTGAADNSAGTIQNVGARVAIGDVNGDGTPDLAVAAGSNGGPRITIWDGKNVATAPGAGTPAAPPLANAFVFEDTQRDGAFVTLGDVTNDGLADLIAGGGPNGGPRVRIGDMAAILAAKNFGKFDDALGVVKSNFFAGDPNTRGGIRVAARDVDGDSIADLVTGSGAGLQSQLQLFLGTRLTTFTAGVQTGDQVENPFNALLGDGVYVG